MQELELRKHPYPYRAAFSFSNDIDLTTVQRYLFLKDLFKNFPASRPSAKDGLPYSESIFVFNCNPHHPEQIALQTHPDLLFPDLESGYLGTLHGWGDFNFNPVFSRNDYLNEGIRLLSQSKCRPRVWTNHGTLHNLQNIGAGIGYGDLPQYRDGAGLSYPLPSYHLDLTRKLGIDFFWDGSLSRIIGQNRELSSSDLWKTLYAAQPCGRRMKDKLLRLVKKYAYMPMKAYITDNRLLEEKTLRDGCRVFVIRRFGHYDKATADNMDQVLPQEVVEKLIANEGVMVFMTHLGKTALAADRMPDNSMRVLRHLKERFDDGDLWVCPLPALLDYQALTESLRIRTVAEARLELSFSNGVWSDFQPEPERLRGLTFYYGRRAPAVIFSGSRRLGFTLNPKDRTGRHSITITGPDIHED